MYSTMNTGKFPKTQSNNSNVGCLKQLVSPNGAIESLTEDWKIR